MNTEPSSEERELDLDEQLVLRDGLTQPFPFLVEQGKPLRAFQLTGRHRIIKDKRIILSLDKGLGKTLTVLSVFEDPEVHQNTPGFTVLILCPEKGIGSFMRDIKLFPDHEHKFQVVLGSKHKRQNQWRNIQAKYFVCTYATFLSDIGVREDRKAADGSTGKLSEAIVPKWVLDGSIDAIVCDEFHRVFRRTKGKFFDYAKRAGSLIQKAKYFIPMSGSAVSRGPEDMWAALHLVDRKLWSTYWGYVGTWCEVDDTGFGKAIRGPRIDRVEKWRSAVGPYVFHRTKDMVGKELPPKQRFLLDVEMTSEQRRLHDQLARESFAQIGDDPETADYVFATSSLAKIHKIRTALICPKALSPSLGYGAGIEGIYDDAQESELTRYLVCTPFRAPLPLLGDYIRGRGGRVWQLQGGIGLEVQERVLREWRDSLRNATPDNPSVLMSTIKYAESWEAPEARYGYMLGMEWDPEDMKQAEDRLHRLTSKAPVFWYYVRHLQAYDDDILNLIVTKGHNREVMFEGWGRIRRALQAAAQNS